MARTHSIGIHNYALIIVRKKTHFISIHKSNVTHARTYSTSHECGNNVVRYKIPFGSNCWIFLFRLSACTVHIYTYARGTHNGNRHALVCDIYAHTISFLHIFFVPFLCVYTFVFVISYIENLTTHIKCFIRLTHWFSWSCFSRRVCECVCESYKSINIPRTTSKTYATLTRSLARSRQNQNLAAHTRSITNTISCKQYMCVRYIECDNSSIIIWYHRAWIVLIDLLIFRRSLW